MCVVCVMFYVVTSYTATVVLKIHLLHSSSKSFNRLKNDSKNNDQKTITNNTALQIWCRDENVMNNKT